MENKKYNFYVHGMHCASCEVLVDSELADLEHISDVKSSLKDGSLKIYGDFKDKTDQEIALELTGLLSKHGYSVSLEKEEVKTKWSDFKIALPIAIIFGVVFILLQKLGIINLVSAKNFNYGTAFLIGIVASLSSCMAVVGGLLLSMSATFSKEGDKIKPQLFFHIGRIISFFILGGVIGYLGSAFTLNTTASFIIGLMVGVVMLILGINLLDIWRTNKFQFLMPKFVSERAYNISKFNHTLTPLLVGIATFFLPCGFTQSMQITALSSGTFLKGGLTMLFFALGTFPILALISFSSSSIKNISKSGVFFKTAGLIVIGFAILNIVNSLVVIGVMKPVFNF